MAMRNEWLARILIFTLLAAALITPVWGLWQRDGWIELRARMPEAGGWSPADLTVQAGESLRLRLTSDDVVHSFAIGQSDRPPVDILPGEVTEIELTFDEPGTYTYYCTRWCGSNHWRMRGTITVHGGEPATTSPPVQPLYAQLGIDLDAPREQIDLDLPGKPSAGRGAKIAARYPVSQFETYLNLEYYRSHTPAEAWNDLRSRPVTLDLNDGQVWDLVAWIWQQNVDAQNLEMGVSLYRQDCAACHGLDGSGNGIFAGTDQFDTDPPFDDDLTGQASEPPPNFSDPKTMLSTSPAILQGKIIRGGMGTGMPSWGLLYTEKQSWALVDYIWSLFFDTNTEE